MGKMKADSSLETKFFKFNAPVGFTYGIVAIGLVFGIIKFHEIGNQDEYIKKQQAKIDSLVTRNIQLLTDNITDTSSNNNTSSFLIKEFFSYRDPKSIFTGKVLIAADAGGMTTNSSLKFTGIIGTSKNSKGPFKDSIIETEKGDKFYFQTFDSLTWGANVVGDDGGGLTLEIYK